MIDDDRMLTQRLLAVSTAFLAILAATAQAGIANRLAFRALERRRAGRATRSRSDD